MIPICRGCISGSHCGGQIAARVNDSIVRCQCIVCEWVAR